MLESLEQTLPRASYLDADLYQREYKAVFRPGWVCVGRAEQVPNPGDYQALRLGTESVLVLRHEDGELRGFYNVCRHRGAELVAMPDTDMRYGSFGRSITCPYHAWNYHLDGTLRAAPHLPVEPGATQLHAVRVDEWGGFVFICLDDRRGATNAARARTDGEGVWRWAAVSARGCRVVCVVQAGRPGGGWRGDLSAAAMPRAKDWTPQTHKHCHHQLRRRLLSGMAR